MPKFAKARITSMQRPQVNLSFIDFFLHIRENLNKTFFFNIYVECKKIISLQISAVQAVLDITYKIAVFTNMDICNIVRQ